MVRQSIWSRVGHWFKGVQRSTEYGIGDGDEATTAPIAMAESSPPGEVGFPATDAGRGGAARPGLVCHRSDSSSLHGPDDGYARIVGLVESIQVHFERQDERSQRIVDALEQLAQSLAHLPEASKTQSDSLARIKEGLEADAGGRQRVEQALAQLPPLADAQRETMVSVARQLDLVRETGDRESQALTSLDAAVSGLSEATGASTTALQQMHADAAAREERIAELVQTQAKQVTRWAYAVFGLAAAAVLVSLVALFG